MGFDGSFNFFNSSLGIGRILNYSARKYTSLVHNDSHPKNIVVDGNEDVVFIDLEMVGVGAPQIDEARFYAHRSLDLDMEEKIKLAEESASRRSAGDEYTAGFHAAVVYSCLNHMAYVSSNSEHCKLA